MMRLWWASLYAAAALAWAEDPPAPQVEKDEKGRQVLEVLTEENLENLKQENSPITLKQLTPKETISLDQAVDMPSDI